MGFAFYALRNWSPNPPDTPKVSMFAQEGGDVGGGNPDTLVFQAYLLDDEPDDGLMGIQLFHRRAEGKVGGTGIIVTFGATLEDHVTPAPSGQADGIHYGILTFTDDDGQPVGWREGRVGYHVFGPPEKAVSDIIIQAGYDVADYPVDSPPTGPPDGIYPPTNLAVGSASDRNVLTWADNSDNELGFKLEWSEVNEDGTIVGNWVKFAEVSTNQIVYEDFDIVEGEVYGYRVLAFKADKQSIYSNEVTTSDILVLDPKTGPVSGRTVFTITGKFDPAGLVSVAFGGKLATGLVVNSGKVTGFTPEYPAKGFVDVTVTRGTSVKVLANAFEYTAGANYPYLDVTDTQNFNPPIPSTVRVAAQIIGDEDGLFSEPRWRWEVIGGPSEEAKAGVSLGSADAQTTTVTATVYEKGTYLVKATAIGVDLTGADVEISNIATITIQSPGIPRVHTATYQTTYPDPVFADPAVEDDGWNGPLTYQWSQVSGPGTATIVTPNARGTQINLPPENGSYSFKLIVSNDKFSGNGIIKVINRSQTLVPEPPPPPGAVTVTIGGNAY